MDEPTYDQINSIQIDELCEFFERDDVLIERLTSPDENVVRISRDQLRSRYKLFQTQADKLKQYA